MAILHQPQHQHQHQLVAQQHRVPPPLAPHRFCKIALQSMGSVEAWIGRAPFAAWLAPAASTSLSTTGSARREHRPPHQRPLKTALRPRQQLLASLGQGSPRRRSEAHACVQNRQFGTAALGSLRHRLQPFAPRTLEVLTHTSLVVAAMASPEVTVGQSLAVVDSTLSPHPRVGRSRFQPLRQAKVPIAPLRTHSSAMGSRTATAGEACKTSPSHSHSRQTASGRRDRLSSCSFGPMAAICLVCCHHRTQMLAAFISSSPLCKTTIPTVGKGPSSCKMVAGTMSRWSSRQAHHLLPSLLMAHCLAAVPCR
mmetsp:Transcript_19137/g.44552  ORF Transcript_19137/g.44552 Transcript_19137/m.44552 type:complete len:310 (-) Transcript_19137:16-945(-)